MWVNPELNLSNAFVAAWLPGSEGIGIADVLFAGADGESRFDFTGRLSYSWPATAGQVELDMTEMFKAKSGSGWHISQIGTSCFTDEGSQMGSVSEPFTINAEGSLKLQISSIKIIDGMGEINCEL